MTSLPAEWPAAVRAACRGAAAAILAVRAEPGALGVEYKHDGSPVSRADHAASSILRERLAALHPALPVICEEGEQDCAGAARFWLVDPLDGTREFLRGSEVFTVNVALVDSARAVFGVVHVPVSGEMYWGGEGLGAFCDAWPLHVRRLADALPAPRVLASPARVAAASVDFLGRLRRRFPDARVEALPGALKFCRLAAGEADLYPRATPSCAWDTAAGQAILEAAGGAVFDAAWEPVRYSQKPGWLNGEFLAVADATQDWRVMLGG